MNQGLEKFTLFLYFRLQLRLSLTKRNLTPLTMAMFVSNTTLDPVVLQGMKIVSTWMFIPLKPYKARGINIQVQTIFISCRTTRSNVVLGTNIAVMRGVEFLLVRLKILHCFFIIGSSWGWTLRRGIWRHWRRQCLSPIRHWIRWSCRRWRLSQLECLYP